MHWPRMTSEMFRPDYNPWRTLPHIQIDLSVDGPDLLAMRRMDQNLSPSIEDHYFRLEHFVRRSATCEAY